MRVVQIVMPVRSSLSLSLSRTHAHDKYTRAHKHTETHPCFSPTPRKRARTLSNFVFKELSRERAGNLQLFFQLSLSTSLKRLSHSLSGDVPLSRRRNGTRPLVIAHRSARAPPQLPFHGPYPNHSIKGFSHPIFGGGGLRREGGP